MPIPTNDENKKQAEMKELFDAYLKAGAKGQEDVKRILGLLHGAESQNTEAQLFLKDLVEKNSCWRT